MEEARQAAWSYLGRENRGKKRLSGPLWGVFGALVASLGWMGYLFLL